MSCGGGECVPRWVGEGGGGELWELWECVWGIGYCMFGVGNMGGRYWGRELSLPL